MHERLRCTLLATAAAVAVALATPAAAQPHGHHPQHAPAAHAGADAPYAGLQRREIKALSAQQIADLRAGRGMTLALSAELNGYPGPAHVIELAEALALSAPQLARTQALFARMQGEASALGEALIDAERALDALFARREAPDDNVGAATARAAQLQGQLRATHLRYHLAMLEVLTPQQIAQYNRLRGY